MNDEGASRGSKTAQACKLRGGTCNSKESELALAAGICKGFLSAVWTNGHCADIPDHASNLVSSYALKSLHDCAYITPTSRCVSGRPALQSRANIATLPNCSSSIRRDRRIFARAEVGIIYSSSVEERLPQIAAHPSVSFTACRAKRNQRRSL